MDRTNDAELVARARTGDVDAFSDLVEPYRAGALRLAYGIAGNEAEDAVQDAFVKAFRKLDTFDSESAFRPWLFTVVANEARNRRRSMTRRASVELRARAQRQPIATASDAIAIEHEERERLVAAVNRLSDDHREIVSLRFFAGLSERETAEVLGCAPGTAKSRVSRALEQLRVALDRELTE